MKEKIYKLTDANGQTYGGTQWGPGITNNAPGGGALCTAAWIHAYRDPILAVLMNPIHGNYKDPQLWEAEGEVGIDDGTKVGCTILTTLRQIPVPIITVEQRMVFYILCAKRAYADPGWIRWADSWLSGADRSEKSVSAEVSAWAAVWAVEAARDLDLIAIAHEAMRERLRHERRDLDSLHQVAGSGSSTEGR